MSWDPLLGPCFSLAFLKCNSNIKLDEREKSEPILTMYFVFCLGVITLWKVKEKQAKDQVIMYEVIGN